MDGEAVLQKSALNALYDKFLKPKTTQNEKKYKTYKSLLEVLKEESKKIVTCESLIAISII